MRGSRSTAERRRATVTALEAYEKYKHLDENLSDRDLIPESFWGSIIFDLWAAVKASIKDNERIK